MIVFVVDAFNEFGSLYAKMSVNKLKLFNKLNCIIIAPFGIF
ncbi:hypothetical protein ABI_15760 [Asticcacaulis biprosthecium C19]|uniref:Uncharacterized protein n=1 Tax=Asticcacaulis biprosthecium C19 TaxID=715226 RepID=F4QJF3_9CAUL|nr:hypothetical protein ABI_15760 [Asticcacaulis biprosthecium C19]